jgi:hypothetical protein
MTRWPAPVDAETTLAQSREAAEDLGLTDIDPAFPEFMAALTMVMQDACCSECPCAQCTRIREIATSLFGMPPE